MKTANQILRHIPNIPPVGMLEHVQYVITVIPTVISVCLHSDRKKSFPSVLKYTLKIQKYSMGKLINRMVRIVARTTPATPELRTKTTFKHKFAAASPIARKRSCSQIPVDSFNTSLISTRQYR